jgi:hypothetical protein
MKAILYQRHFMALLVLVRKSELGKHINKASPFEFFTPIERYYLQLFIKVYFNSISLILITQYVAK